VSAAFDVGHHNEQVAAMPDRPRGEDLCPQHGCRCEPLLNRCDKEGARNPRGRRPCGRVDERAGRFDINGGGRKSSEPVGVRRRTAVDRRKPWGAENSSPLPLLNGRFAAVKNNRQPDKLPSTNEHHAGHRVSVKAARCELGSAHNVLLVRGFGGQVWTVPGCGS
jgi:hypothetical protein